MHLLSLLEKGLMLAMKSTLKSSVITLEYVYIVKSVTALTSLLLY